MSCWKPRVQRSAVHHPVQSDGHGVWEVCAFRHFSDASNNSLPWSLLHLPNQIRERGQGILHAGKSSAHWGKTWSILSLAECPDSTTELFIPSVWGIFYKQTHRAVCWSAGTAGTLRRVTYPKQTCFSYETVGLGKPRAVPVSKNSSGLPSSRGTIVLTCFLFDEQSTTKRLNVSCLFY